MRLQQRAHEDLQGGVRTMHGDRGWALRTMRKSEFCELGGSPAEGDDLDDEDAKDGDEGECECVWL